MSDEPIRVRVYGFWRLTRRTYMILQFALMGLLFALMLWWLLAGMPRHFRGHSLANQILRNLHWLFVAALVFEFFETYFVLSAFHHKQRIADRAKRK